MLSLKKMALGIAAVTLAMLGDVAPANAMPDLNSYSALDCSMDGLAQVDGRAVYLWNCNNSFHAQITNASEHDLVYLKGDGAGKTAYATVPFGSTRADTTSVGPEGGPWHACGAVNNRPDEVCT